METFRRWLNTALLVVIVAFLAALYGEAESMALYLDSIDGWTSIAAGQGMRQENRELTGR